MKPWSGIIFAVLLIGLALPTVHAQESVTAEATKDNSIWSGASGSDTDPELANGAGNRIIIGIQGINPSNNADAKRMRSMVAFDISAIPDGATITSASVQMNVGSVGYDGVRDSPFVTPIDVTLHRLTSDFGEGTSSLYEAGFGGGAGGGTATTGDATWSYNLFDTSQWTTPGGDFVAQASATLAINNLGAVTWSSADIIADVQSWVDGTNNNYGWMIISDETYNPGNANSEPCCVYVQFDSKEATNAANRPKLLVEYTTVEDNTAPIVASYTPADNAVNVAVSTNLSVRFNESITTGTGNITLFDEGGQTVEQFDVTGITPTTTTVTDDTITLDPASVLNGGTAYYVQIDATAIEDLAGNSYAGINNATTWNFTTDTNTDLNADGATTPADAVFVINRVGETPTGENAAADVDGDDDIDVDDVVLVIDAIGTLVP